MPRKARLKSKSGIYHVMVRGINRQNIFEDQEDYIKFIQVLQKYKEKSGFNIFAYCLMSNHVHLLLKTGLEPLEQVMRRICGSYVYWYNLKYQRIGNLFQDRFRSEPVENDAYFLTAQRYIHQNPLKAGLAGSIEQYKWSSYNDYVNKTKLIDAGFLLEFFNADIKKAVKGFIEYVNEVNNDACLDLEEKYRIADDEAREIIKNICQVQNTTDLQNIDILKRNKYLKRLKEEKKLSIRQIERLTGINRGAILRS